MFPRQGDWTESEYLSLGSARFIEFSDGVLEFPPPPKMSHVRIAKFLSELLSSHVSAQRLGEVYWAPCPIRVGQKKFREPDVLFLATERIPPADEPPDGADLVMEVMNEGKEHRLRDLETKREEYAAAGIPEYWIIDPEFQTIHVLTLAEGEYKDHRTFPIGSTATSVVLPEFKVEVSSVFAAAKPRS